MGVKGWNQFLVQKGWIPSLQEDSDADDDGAVDLWGHSGFLTRHNHTLVRLSPGSHLHVDGLSLCFHLHRVAYARHTADRDRATSMGTFAGLQLLPTFLPLPVLHAVTKEWIDTLVTQCGMQVTIYMDGKQRYQTMLEDDDEVEDEVETPYVCYEATFKEPTETKRRVERQQELSLLQQFCLTGRLPNNSMSFEAKLPKGQLWLAQILHTLQCSGCIPIVWCPGEADRVVVEAAATADHQYVVGTDSDYCFFQDCHYIPLTTLQVTGRTVAACVLHRATLAHALGLPAEELMVELAILLGNDYIDLSSHTDDDAALSKCHGHPERILVLLRQRGPQFRVTSSDRGIQRGLVFVRRLYQLESLEEFTVTEGPHDANTTTNGTVWIRDQVLQTLEQKVTGSNNNSTIIIQPIHVQAFAQLRDTPSLTTAWRPQWNDMLAARYIETTIARAVRQRLRNNTTNSGMLKLQAPYALFDSFLFHSILHQLRRQHQAALPPARVQPSRPEEQRPVSLPVDAHAEEILHSVRHNRVTIIQGETGCGKSSRIPILLLNAPPPPGSSSAKKVQLFVSQPRRIAAKALVERLRSVEPKWRDHIALRMGHGVREYETDSTRAWFVTTGYLVRLLASHPHRFDHITYLIIDEVHERSVDTDLLCLLCKRLLHTNPNIRLVLMSATLAAALYRDYFNVDGPTVLVGARLHPVQYKFVEEILDETLHSNEMQYIANKSPSHFGQPPRHEYMHKLHIAVAQLTTTIGVPGTSVLIFVAGMNDIIALSDLIDNIYVPDCTFTCFPIHGDIPFEEQMQVFDSPAADEVKVIIATNAAESSVTLPDVDNVICLGLCKQITYNPKSHRQMLIPAWISQASAEQRAGRTGRVRPGTVYRVYSRELFDQMAKYEEGEICRIPLDSVILLLKEILADDDEVVPALLDCLEPPNVTTIDRSFESLFRHQFITSPSDKGAITNLGKFVASLGIDLTLGALIGLGIQFGVGAEAVQLAGVLSATKDPWVISNPMIHEAYDYNEMMHRTYTSKVHFDANQFSEPFSAMNLLWAFQQVSSGRRNAWCRLYGVFLPRIRRLQSTCEHLADRVASFLHMDRDLLLVSHPPCQMPHSMTLILRTVQVWVFSDSIIELRKDHGLLGGRVTTDKEESSFTVALERKSKSIEVKHLKQILSEDRHPFRLESPKKMKYSGGFKIISSVQDLARKSASGEFDSVVEPRLLSFATEKDLDFACYMFDDRAAVYLRRNGETAALATGLKQELQTCEVWAVRRSGLKRGLGERPCGLWLVQASSEPSYKDAVMWEKIYSTDSCGNRNIESFMNVLHRPNALNGILLRFSWLASDYRFSSELSFHLLCSQLLTTPDMKDLLSTPEIVSLKEKHQQGRQMVNFRMEPNKPIQRSETDIADSPSWSFPFVRESLIPEGARILAVLASGRRKQHFIRLHDAQKDEGPDPRDKSLDIWFADEVDFAAGYWRRIDSDAMAYVPSNSVPASAIPMDSNTTRFCCCADVLEVRGGHIRANGLTLLPNREFVALCFVSFGLKVMDNIDYDGLTPWEAALKWSSNNSDAEHPPEILDRLVAAEAFHKRSLGMGESLKCFPHKVKELLAIFDGFDGVRYEAWDSLDSNPFLPGKKAQKATVPTEATTNPPPTFDTLAALCDDLFATHLPNGRVLNDHTLYSSNLLALLVSTVRRERQSASVDTTFSLAQEGNKDWMIDATTLSPSGQQPWFGVTFQNYGFRYASPHPAITKLETVHECVPPPFRYVLDSVVVQRGVVYHTSLELAVRIAAAIWLERQFKVGNGTIHWYQRSDVDGMLATLRALAL